MIRPDLVDCWIFRVTPAGECEILLIRRAPGRILPGLWQCVSGSIDDGERITMAALREVAEETGLAGPDIEAFYDLDLVNQFHEPSVDAVLVAAVFAVRVRPDASVTLSHEHDGQRWLPIEEAWSEVVWPGYRDAIERVGDQLLDPDRSAWFELEPGTGARRVGAWPAEGDVAR
ncbi:MAG TPA: NUDIX domain-containing protein [Candidatus Deferrimicrobiaceae bacterium]|nr:NUDIX domain-containing protein [Candidatus Deferrimicrobiaceae bacterium]